MQSNLPIQRLQLERRRSENWNLAERAEYQRLVAPLKAVNYLLEWASSLFGVADSFYVAEAFAAWDDEHREAYVHWLRRPVVPQEHLWGQF